MGTKGGNKDDQGSQKENLRSISSSKLAAVAKSVAFITIESFDCTNRCVFGENAAQDTIKAQNNNNLIIENVKMCRFFSEGARSTDPIESFVCARVLRVLKFFIFQKYIQYKQVFK